LSGLDAEFQNCPGSCPFEQGDDCANCPNKQEQEKFEQDLTEQLRRALPETWKKWGIENLIGCVLEVADAKQNLPREKWTIKTGRLVNAFTVEKSNFEAAETARLNSARQNTDS
jgi:hypothetical protein